MLANNHVPWRHSLSQSQSPEANQYSDCDALRGMFGHIGRYYPEKDNMKIPWINSRHIDSYDHCGLSGTYIIPYHMQRLQNLKLPYQLTPETGYEP